MNIFFVDKMKKNPFETGWEGSLYPGIIGITIGKKSMYWPKERYSSSKSSSNMIGNQGKKLDNYKRYNEVADTIYSIDLSKTPYIRSKFQEAIGLQNLGAKLAALSEDPLIKESMELRLKDIRSGNRGEYENKDYYHNIKIRQLMDSIRRYAWYSISDDPEVQEEITKQRTATYRRSQKKRESLGLKPILNIYK